ncbi:hypothetical protein C9J60_25300 [Streptomyces sp. A244]|nr:hypothetical protein C9J60_25300 [Streptomyces sp. A244]
MIRAGGATALATRRRTTRANPLYTARCGDGHDLTTHTNRVPHNAARSGPRSSSEDRGPDRAVWLWLWLCGRTWVSPG